MKRIIHFILTIIFISVAAFSQTTKKVTTEYTYYAAETQSIQEAKRIALDRAKIQAIADEFGTSVSQTNYTITKIRNGKTTEDFQSIGFSDLRGEWIETIGEPHYEISYSEGMQIVKVNVKGIIRSISNSLPQLEVKLLRNKPEPRYESSEFRNNDDIYVSFRSPSDGHLAIYLLDNDDNAFCLLPYARQTNGVYNVVGNKEYIFFSKDKCNPSERNHVDEYTMTCDGQPEDSKIVVIFSDNLFTKSNDKNKSELSARQLSQKEFNTWMAKSRNSDTHMQVIEIQFKIIP